MAVQGVQGNPDRPRVHTEPRTAWVPWAREVGSSVRVRRGPTVTEGRHRAGAFPPDACTRRGRPAVSASQCVRADATVLLAQPPKDAPPQPPIQRREFLRGADGMSEV